jgi:hypothetical protein
MSVCYAIAYLPCLACPSYLNLTNQASNIEEDTLSGIPVVRHNFFVPLHAFRPLSGYREADRAVLVAS